MASLRQAGADAAMALRFVRGLPRYLRRPLAPAEIAAIIAGRRAARADNFLRLADGAIYGRARSPYRALLRAAGCERGDLARLLAAEGVEGALGVLAARGVFVTVDELKGRTPIVRGSVRLEAHADDFRNPLATAHLWASTGGSRGTPLPVTLDLACVRDRAVNMLAGLHAHGGARWRTAVWGLRGMVPMLWYSAGDPRAARWFTQVDVAALGATSRFAWTARLLAWESRVLGAALPAPEYAPLDAPAAVLRWLEATLAAGAVPHLWGTPSAMLRLAAAAAAAGIDIAGTALTITGEPITAARLAVLRRAGTIPIADYGSVESGGTIAYGCLAPTAADDVHVFDDVNAVIAAPAATPLAGALLVSSLLASSPFLLLNASLGDRATRVERTCGCPMERHGWRTHLADIRSFGKLTAGGLTFEDGAVLDILEERLPGRFGGRPTDYQLVEELNEAGHARVRLLVDPAVGPIDTGQVRDAFLEALGEGTEIARDMAEQWRATATVEVCRMPPERTAAGKILHRVARAGSATR